MPPWDRCHNVNLGEREPGMAVFVLSCRRPTTLRPIQVHRRLRFCWQHSRIRRRWFGPTLRFPVLLWPF